MDDTKPAVDFLSRIESGEFNGRLYHTILNLSKTDLDQIAAVLRVRHRASLHGLASTSRDIDRIPVR